MGGDISETCRWSAAKCQARGGSLARRGGHASRGGRGGRGARRPL